MEALLRAIAARQPRGVDILVHPSVVSDSEVHFDVKYTLNTWVMEKHYRVYVTDTEVQIHLETFSIERSV